MATQDLLKQDVREPKLNSSTQRAILNSLSPLLGYGEQCSNALRSHCFNKLVTTHEEILDIIQHLKDLNLTREKLIEDVGKERPQASSTFISELVDLAARLWLMVDIGQLKHGFVPGQKPLLWERESLEELLVKRFATPNATSTRRLRVKLDRLFCARNFERIAGLQVIWMDNISDHLRLMVDDTRIAIYHHASFLEHNKSNNIFPPKFIEETLRTLSLLLPRYDKKSRQWFKTQQLKHGLDHSAAAAGHLTTEERQIDNFDFWHDRLCVLKQVFDEAEPSTILQWWCDRRRRVQWYTFWVAALVLSLTIFFGSIQCIEGAFQVYKAYHP